MDGQRTEGHGADYTTPGTRPEFRLWAPPGLVRHNDEEPVQRPLGGDDLKSPPSTSGKVPSEERAHAPDLSEVRDLLRYATLVTIGVVASSLVIGGCRGELDAIRDCLMIAGWLLLIAWMGTLLVVAVVSFAVIIPWIFRRLVRWASRKPNVGDGVADDWLDGPP